MKAMILDNIKLSMAETLDNYVFCGKSEKLPTYNYFVENGMVEQINNLCVNQVVKNLFLEEPEMWLVSLLDCTNIAEFEEVLFQDFTDMRDILSRMELIEETELPSSTTWIEAPKEMKTKDLKCSSRSVRPVTLAPDELMALDEYDATITFLKTLDSNHLIQYDIINSFVETLLDMQSRKDIVSVIDILYQNFVIGLQIIKNASPDEAREFLSCVMKRYIMNTKED